MFFFQFAFTVGIVFCIMSVVLFPSFYLPTFVCKWDILA